MAVVKYCTFLYGIQVDEDDLLEPDSNLIQTLRLMLEDHSKYNIQSMKFTAPSVQNELLDIMAQLVLRGLLSKIRKRKYYSIMADESSDVSNKEQMCLVLR